MGALQGGPLMRARHANDFVRLTSLAWRRFERPETELAVVGVRGWRRSRWASLIGAQWRANGRLGKVSEQLATKQTIGGRPGRVRGADLAN